MGESGKCSVSSMCVCMYNTIITKYKGHKACVVGLVLIFFLISKNILWETGQFTQGSVFYIHITSRRIVVQLTKYFVCTNTSLQTLHKISYDARMRMYNTIITKYQGHKACVVGLLSKNILWETVQFTQGSVFLHSYN